MASVPSIRVTLDGPLPVYRQIADQVRLLIAEGVLRPEQELPSVRALALQLGVHFNTVADAYRSLGEEGCVEVNQGKRVRVKPQRATRTIDSRSLLEFRTRLRHLLAEMQLEGMSAEAIRDEVLQVLEKKK